MAADKAARFLCRPGGSRAKARTERTHLRRILNSVYLLSMVTAVPSALVAAGNLPDLMEAGVPNVDALRSHFRSSITDVLVQPGDNSIGGVGTGILELDSRGVTINQ